MKTPAGVRTVARRMGFPMVPEARLEHVAIAVHDLDAAIAVYSAILGKPESGRETVETEGVRVAFFDLGGPRIELLEPTGEDTAVGRFLESRGPGLHHIAFDVPDIEEAMRRCSDAGLQTVGAAPRRGAGGRKIAFLHPGGVLIELSERVD